MTDLIYITALERDFADAINRSTSMDELADYLGSRFISICSDTERPDFIHVKRNKFITRHPVSIEHIGKVLKINADKRTGSRKQNKTEASGGSGGTQQDLRPKDIFDRDDFSNGPRR